MKLNHRFACDRRAEGVNKVAEEILGDSIFVIQIINLKLSENFETAAAKIDAKLVEIFNNKGKKKIIHGEGVGLVDACFDAIMNNYDAQYCSLRKISIADFRVSAHLDHGTLLRSEANVTAKLRVKNSQNQDYSFECTTSSISHSSVAVVQGAISFFINAELAYVRLHRALRDAKDRSRYDLVERFQNQMGTLVQATSYEELASSLLNR